MTIEDHKSLELAGLVRNVCKNLEELVSKIQIKSNIYLDEIKNLKYEQLKAEEAHQELFERLEKLENTFNPSTSIPPSRFLKSGDCPFCQGTGRENTVRGGNLLFSPPPEYKNEL